MIKIRAELFLDTGPGKRAQPVSSGYRPTFDVNGYLQSRSATQGGLSSGAITLLDRETLAPGESAIVEVCLLSGVVKPNQHISFTEGLTVVGYIMVLEVLAGE